MSFKAIEELGLPESSAMENGEYRKLRDFFQALENDSDPGDTSIVDASYHSTFLFCGPQGVDPIQKSDFLNFIPVMSRKFSDMGFKSKRVKNLGVSKLDSLYFQARVNWEMLFERNGKAEVFDNINATYILRKERDSFKIIMQLDHQNLHDMVNQGGIPGSA